MLIYIDSVNTVVIEETQDLTDGYHAPWCVANGPARSALFRPDGDTLWNVTAELVAGTELEWDTVHGDEAIFVLSGDLEVNGRRCGPEGVVIVESGVPATIRAVVDTSLLHFGPASPEPPSDGPIGPAAPDGHSVRVLTAEEAETLRTGVLTFYTDGSDPTCRMAFFLNDGNHSDAARSVGSHKHSADEIIHVVEGSISLGPSTVAAGRSVFVPGDRRYGFRTPGRLRFLNYRRDVSTVVHTPGTEPEIESRARTAALHARGESKMELDA